MKGLLTLILSAAMTAAVAYLPVRPAFDEEGVYTVYRYSASSLAASERFEGNYIWDSRTVEGESVSFMDASFDLAAALDRYAAKLLFSEQAGDVTVYYAFSPLLTYRAALCGQTVNLQIAVENERVTLGTPLIFGSF